MSIRVITEWEREGPTGTACALENIESLCELFHIDRLHFPVHLKATSTLERKSSTPVSSFNTNPAIRALVSGIAEHLFRDYSPCVAWWLIFVLIFKFHKVHGFWMLLEEIVTTS